MKLSVIHIFLLLLSSLSTTIAGSIPDGVYERRDTSKKLNPLVDDSLQLDTRSAESAQIVPAVLLVLGIGTPILGQILYTIKTKPQATYTEPKGGKAPATQLLQQAVNWISQNSVFGAIAIRSTATSSVGLSGDFGKDWGSSTLTVNAADGQSQWTLYWGRSGTITVDTSEITQSVVASSGSTSTNHDPGLNPKQWVYTISHS